MRVYKAANIIRIIYLHILDYIALIHYDMIFNNRNEFENCNLKNSMCPKYAIVIANPQNAD